MREQLLAFACLVAAPSIATAQDLNKVELGTHELSEMKTLNGVRLVFDPTKIRMAYALPRASGRGFVTNIIGLAGGPQEIDEPADSLLERLNLKPYFVALTLPDGGSGLGEDFRHLIFPLNRVLGSYPSRSQDCSEHRRSTDLRERKRRNYQRRHQCDATTK